MESNWRGIVVAIACIAVVGLPAGAQQGITGKMLLRTTTTESGQPLQFPLFRNQVTAVRVEVDPGITSGATRIHVPAVVYVLEGSAIIERDGQPPRSILAGQAAALPLNSPLAIANRGPGPVKVLIVLFGETGKPTVTGWVLGSALQPAVTPGARTTLMLNTTKDVIGGPILFPVFANQLDVRLAEFAPGAVNPRHSHAHIAFVYILEGALTFSKLDGLPPKTLKQGDLGFEPMISHDGTNAATMPTRFLVIFVGDAATPPLVYLPQ